MITVTEEVKTLLGAQDVPTGSVLRLDPVEGEQKTEQVELGFVAGEPRDDDQVVEQAGEEILRIAGPLSEMLSGSVMDVVVQESENGSEGPVMGIGIRPAGDDDSSADLP